MTGHYWLDDPDVPFATLLCVAGTYCHPEADPDAYGDLIRLAPGTAQPPVPVGQCLTRRRPQGPR